MTPVISAELGARDSVPADKDYNREIAARLILTRRALGFDGPRAHTRFLNALRSTMPITLPRWGNYEGGHQRITPDVALALCERFDLTLDWIYRGKRRGLPNDLLAAMQKIEEAN